MKKSFLIKVSYLSIILIMSCASLEPKDKELTSRGKYSFSSEMQFLSGNIFIYNSEIKKIKFDINGLGRKFQIIFRNKKLISNFSYSEFIEEEELMKLVKWLFFKCESSECRKISLNSIMLEKIYSDKTSLTIKGNVKNYRLSIKLNDS
jgi:hypothetical protein